MALIEDKPITLMTGLPGSGKTALIVKYIKEATDKGRPVFQIGIPELKLPHFPVPPIEEWTVLRPDPDHPELMLPYFNFPDNSLIVLSEAQRIYRPRPAASKLPDHVAAFETVRHTGVTFIFDTQHPDFIDGHVRKLVGQHIHLLDHGILGRKHYEWPYCGSPEQFKGAPIKKGYTLPKEVFGLYKSASLHIKRKYTIPPAVVALGALLICLGVGSYLLYGSMQKKFAPAKPVEVATSASSAPAVPDSLPAPKPGSTPGDLLIQFDPAVPGRPETAPAFDQLRQVKAMPIVVGCIKTARRCTCQNQQGLDAGLDTLQCEAWMKNPPFDPYRDPPPLARESTPRDVTAKPAGQAGGFPAAQLVPGSVTL